MITLKAKYDFWKEVSVKSPGSDGGFEQTTFEVKFLYEPGSSKKMAQKIMNALPGEQEKLGVDFIKSVICDWRGVEDDKGNPIKFSKHILTQILDTPWLARAILSVWSDAISGEPELGN